MHLHGINHNLVCILVISSFPHILQIFIGLIFICACTTVGKINNLSSTVQDYIDNSDDGHDINPDVPNTPNVVKRSHAYAGFLTYVTLTVTAYEGAVVALRFFTFYHSNTNIVRYLIVVSIQ